MRLANSPEQAVSGAIYDSTASSAWARLNKIAAVYEYNEKGDSTTKAEIWEWR